MYSVHIIYITYDKKKDKRKKLNKSKKTKKKMKTLQKYPSLNNGTKDIISKEANVIYKDVQYSYFIERTQNKVLPIYSDIRNGRTRILTILRRIEGDVEVIG